MDNAPANTPAVSTPSHEPALRPELIHHSQAFPAFCRICRFKNEFMPPEKGGDFWTEVHAVPTESLPTTCQVTGLPGPCGSLGAVTDDVLRRMQIDAHEAPPTLWRRIMMSDKLFAGRPLRPPEATKDWFRLRLRNMRPIDKSSVHLAHFRTITEWIQTWDGLPVLRDGEGRYTMFHCLPVENLISGHSKAPGSKGVLIDGCMRNGIRHGDGIGVYAYSYFPDFWCKPGQGDCVLELRAEPYLTSLKSGTAGRYVMKAQQKTDDSIGSECHLIEVIALWLIYSDVPNCMRV